MCPLWLLSLSPVLPCRWPLTVTGIKGSFAHQDVVPLQSRSRWAKTICPAPPRRQGGVTSGACVCVCLRGVTMIKPRRAGQTQRGRGRRNRWTHRCPPTLDLAGVAKEIGPQKGGGGGRILSSVMLICCCGSQLGFNEHSLLGANEPASQSVPGWNQQIFSNHILIGFLLELEKDKVFSLESLSYLALLTSRTWLLRTPVAAWLAAPLARPAACPS